MARSWKFAAHDRGVVGRFVREIGCSPLLAQVLVARGLESGLAAKSFLDARIGELHDPCLLPGVSDAADRIVAALKAERRITVYGDYDVDGVTATSILWHCLKLAGGKVDYYIPSRLEEGYGLNQEAIRKLHAEDPQRLLITVDCGICSVREADLARDLGLELIITDHHTMGAELPRAAVLVHPRLPNSQYPFGDLCGAGVAFKLAWAICQRLGDGQKATPQMREFLKSAVGLAAMGTVADVVPLVGENRILVRYGLATLVEKSSYGLQMLLKVAELDKEPLLSAEDIGFGLAPRLNAAGRLGQARLAVELLTTDNRERAIQLAAYIDELNKNRQTIERRMTKEATEQIEKHNWQDRGALVLADEEWHPGVIGIVAGRLAEKYEKPTIVIAISSREEAGASDGTLFPSEAPLCAIGQGSGRSFANFDLHGGLTHCSKHLIAFGGHRVAAGLRIHAEEIESFREAFIQHVEANHTRKAQDTEISIDAEISLADLTNRAVRELERLGPFGSEHDRPVFAATGIRLAEPPHKMGQGERHLSLKVKQSNKTMRAIAFGRAEWADEMSQCTGSISLCFAPIINRFRGYENVELQLIDWQPDNPVASASEL